MFIKTVESATRSATLSRPLTRQRLGGSPESPFPIIDIVVIVIKNIFSSLLQYTMNMRAAHIIHFEICEKKLVFALKKVWYLLFWFPSFGECQLFLFKRGFKNQSAV